jgi:prolyl oligopeptidase PreP (S9A serine peptidase family)
MIVCGSRDIRTHPWHGRKMAAALDAANPNGRPVLLRVHEGRGHFTAASHAPPQVIAEWLGFLMRELGLPLPADPLE